MMKNQTKKTRTYSSKKKKTNHQRRISLLLLLLLFLGFATYGSYNYFTTSTSLAKDTMNLRSKVYQVGADANQAQTGDGTAGSQVQRAQLTRQRANTQVQSQTADINQDETSLDETQQSGNNQAEGKIDENQEPDNNHENIQADETQETDDQATFDKYQEFGEFDWVYVGNTQEKQISSVQDTFELPANNRYLQQISNQEFQNVIAGDVFRKTVRMKLTGQANTKTRVTLAWLPVENEITEAVDAKVFVKKDQLTTSGQAPMFTTDNFLTAFEHLPNQQNEVYSDERIDLLNNEYLDIEMVLVVKNRQMLDENRPIAQIERQLMIQLSQDTGTIIQI